MFGKRKPEVAVKVGVSTIGPCAPPETAQENALHLDTRCALLSLREAGQWVVVGTVVALAADDGYNTRVPRLQGFPS